MKFKLLLILLFIPQLACAFYAKRHPCCGFTAPCGWWGSAEYLFLWRKSRYYPPLVTTNPTVVPTLGTAGTTILFGDEFIGGAPKGGARGDFGLWCSKCFGFGGGIFFLSEEDVEYNLNGSSTGTPIFGVPYFDTSAGVQAVDLLSFPTLQLNGSVDIETANRLWGLDLYVRYRFFDTCCFKFDFLGGFVYHSLNDNFDMNTETTSAVLETVKITDNFSCANLYYAGLVGLNAEWKTSNWSFMVIGKLGLGNMHKEVKIAGTTTTSLAGVTAITSSGLLAQPSNSGTHTNTKFEIVPQVSAKIQLRFRPHIWASLGYTYLYYPAVDFAGNQIDRAINPTQNPGPTVGTPSPYFHENLTSFWVQGITAGLYFNY